MTGRLGPPEHVSVASMEQVTKLPLLWVYVFYPVRQCFIRIARFVGDYYVYVLTEQRWNRYHQHQDHPNHQRMFSRPNPRRRSNQVKHHHFIQHAHLNSSCLTAY
jgi:hypothetical protein